MVWGASTGRPSEVTQLRWLWRRWMRIVGYLIRHKRGRPVTEEEYQHLHAAILTACTRREEEASEDLKPFFRRLHDLVEPWVTLESLAKAGKPILTDLWRQCHEADQTLGGPRPWVRGIFFASAFLGGVILVMIVVQALLAWMGEFGMSSLLVEGRSLGYRLWFAIQRASYLEKFGVLTLILVLLGIGMMKSMRSY